MDYPRNATQSRHGALPARLCHSGGHCDGCI